MLRPFESPIIALHGASGVGKSTVAERLLTQSSLRLSFADPVKEFLQVVFGFDQRRLWGHSERRNAPIRLSPQDWNIARLRFNAHAYDWSASTQMHRHLALIDWFNHIEDQYYRLTQTPSSTVFNARFLCRSLAEDWGCACDPLVWVRVLALRIHKRFSTFRYGPSTTKCIIIDDARKGAEIHALAAWGAGIIMLKPSTYVPFDTHPSEIEMYSPEIEKLSHYTLKLDNPVRLRMDQDWRYEGDEAVCAREEAEEREKILASIQAIKDAGTRGIYKGQCETWLRTHSF